MTLKVRPQISLKTIILGAYCNLYSRKKDRPYFFYTLKSEDIDHDQNQKIQPDEHLNNMQDIQI